MVGLLAFACFACDFLSIAILSLDLSCWVSWECDTNCDTLMMPDDIALTDDYVAALLAKDAKAVSSRAAAGLGSSASTR